MHATDRVVLLTEAFYRGLLELEEAKELAPLVEAGVELITRISDARVGYVEFFPLEATQQPLFRATHCDTGRLDIDPWISRSIIQAAVEDRSTINVAFAALHPRFRMCPSVMTNALRAVLCTPIGKHDPVGVVYVQGRQGPGRFPHLDQERAETFAERLATISDRIRAGETASRPTLAEEVRRFERARARRSLERNRGNLSSTARELGVPRSRLYRILKREP